MTVNCCSILAANLAEAARPAGIPTLVAFFSAKIAGQVVVDRGHADLIVANNVLAQVPELNDFVVGMAPRRRAS